MVQLSIKPDQIISYMSYWKTKSSKDFNIEIELNPGEITLNVEKLNQSSSHTLVQYREGGSEEFILDPTLTYMACIKGKVSESLDVQLVLNAYNNKKRVLTQYIGLDINKIIEFPDDVNGISLALRVSGAGHAKIGDIQIQGFKSNLENLEENIHDINTAAEYLILTNVYPEKNNLYRNMFVHRRAELYEKESIKADVFRFNAKEQTLGYYEFEKLFIMLGGKKALVNLLNRKKYKKILIHFVEKDMIQAIEISKANQTPIIVWIHGIETEKWYRRWFNFTRSSKELEGAFRSIPTNNERMKFMKSIYESETLNIKFVFVSKWFKEAVAENDTNSQVKNYAIIHNVIDNKLFNYQKKDKEQRKKILSIRPYASHKYANDLSVKAILELAQKDYFNELEFTLYGHGALFHEIVAPIRHFENVSIHNYFLPQSKIADLHKEHGLFLCPTRHDSQGVSMCEAMSSGLVPITSSVSAIPEFVDNSSGFLAPREDYRGLAQAIEFLYYHPGVFFEKSSNAAKRMREQCGVEQVIDQEINEILN